MLGAGSNSESQKTTILKIAILGVGLLVDWRVHLELKDEIIKFLSLRKRYSLKVY